MSAISLLLAFVLSVYLLEKDYSQEQTAKQINKIALAEIGRANVEGDEREVVFVFLPTFSFDLGSAEIKADDKIIGLVRILNSRKANTKSLYIEGHTSSEGSDSYNYSLGLMRANAARDYFVNLGLNVDRIKIKSFGSTIPASKKFHKNRRVELLIYEE